MISYELALETTEDDKYFCERKCNVLDVILGRNYGASRHVDSSKLCKPSHFQLVIPLSSILMDFL